MIKLKKIIKKLIKRYILIKIILHVLRYLIEIKYRKCNSLIDISGDMYYKYSDQMIIMLRPLLNNYIKHIEKNNIIISVNNFVAIGHLYPEIDLLLRELKNNKAIKNKIIWFTAPKSKLIIEKKEIFERENLKIKISGLIHLISTLAMKIRPDLSICVSQSSLNIINGRKNISACEVFQGRQLNRARRLKEDQNVFPLREYGEANNSKKILVELGISEPYAVVQIKDKAINGTFKPVDPNTYCGVINYLHENGYSIVFAGREKMPECFKMLGVINYAESKYANGINDYLIVYNAEMIIGSASGYVMIAELLNKPLVSVNAWQHVSYIGKKTVLVPTILTKNGKKMKYEDQRMYAFSDTMLDDNNLPINKFEINSIDATSDDIVDATRELVQLMKDGFGYTESQIRLKNKNMHNMLGVGESRISEKFIAKNRKIFFNEN